MGLRRKRYSLIVSAGTREGCAANPEMTCLPVLVLEPAYAPPSRDVGPRLETFVLPYIRANAVFCMRQHGCEGGSVFQKLVQLRH
jgi:hypothetical protein